MKKILAGAFLILLCSVISSLSLAAEDTGLKGSASDFLNLAYEMYQVGNYKSAIPYFKKTVALDPNLAEAHFYLGKSYYLTGDNDQAAESLQNVINLKGSHKESTYLLSLISNLSKKISIDLKDADLKEVLRVLSDETGLNLIAGPSVYGKITVKLKEVLPEAALKTILESNGYTYTLKGNIIEVIPQAGKRRIIREGSNVIRTFASKYLKAEDLAATLENLLGHSAQIIITKGSDTLIVKGSPEVVEKAAVLISQIDLEPKIVMVESKIIETKFDVLSSLGNNLSYGEPDLTSSRDKLQILGMANTPNPTTSTGMFYSVTRGKATDLLEALSTKTDYKVLSSPRIIAIDNQAAEIIMGSRLGYKVKTVTTTGIIESVEFLDVGTKLVFTPHIKDDDNIILDIHPEISEGTISDGLPQKNSTETTTTVAAKNGDTIILGGLVKEKAQEVNKGVPILQDIPILGIPFRRTEITTEKREILIFITLNIIDQDMIGKMPNEINRMKEKSYREVNPSHLF